MAHRFGLVTAVLGFLFASMWSVPHAAADPTYNIVETGCTSDNGGCVGFDDSALNLPLTIGSVTGSGSYLSNDVLFSESGDLNFGISNSVPNPSFSSYSPEYCAIDRLGGSACSVDLSLSATASGVSGQFNFIDRTESRDADLIFDGTTFSGEWGSDYYFDGCGTFAACYITGDLVNLAQVPEPSSLPMLLAGLSLIGGTLYFGRKKPRPA